VALPINFLTTSGPLRYLEPAVYRSDVVESLLRPVYLKETRKHHEGGELSEADFKRVEDRAVDEAVALQVRAGVSVPVALNHSARFRQTELRFSGW